MNETEKYQVLKEGFVLNPNLLLCPIGIQDYTESSVSSAMKPSLAHKEMRTGINQYVISICKPKQIVKLTRSSRSSMV